MATSATKKNRANLLRSLRVEGLESRQLLSATEGPTDTYHEYSSDYSQDYAAPQIETTVIDNGSGILTVQYDVAYDSNVPLTVSIDWGNGITQDIPKNGVLYQDVGAGSEYGFTLTAQAEDGTTSMSMVSGSSASASDTGIPPTFAGIWAWYDSYYGEITVAGTVGDDNTPPEDIDLLIEITFADGSTQIYNANPDENGNIYIQIPCSGQPVGATITATDAFGNSVTEDIWDY